MSRSDNGEHLKWMKDAGFSAAEEAGAEKVLKALYDHPQARGAVEPPPGYENRLLAALNAQLPEVKAPAPKQRSSKTSWGFLGWGQLTWGLTGVGVAVLVFSLLGHPAAVSPGGDLLLKTAQKNPEAVSEWLASIGASKPLTVASADLHMDLSDEDPKAVEEALKKVARQMGMNP